MAGLASGFLCPACGHEGDGPPHDLMSFVYLDDTIIEVILHCRRCEKVWQECLI